MPLSSSPCCKYFTWWCRSFNDCVLFRAIISINTLASRRWQREFEEFEENDTACMRPSVIVHLACRFSRATGRI